MLYIKNFSQENKSDPTKEYWGNNYIDDSLSGLVIGGGIAGLGNVLIGDKKKSTMRRFLEGAGVGAIVGAGAGLARSGLKHKDKQIESLKKDVEAGDEAYVNAVADRNAAQYERDSAVKDKDSLAEENRSVKDLLSGSTNRVSKLEKSLDSLEKAFGSVEDHNQRLKGDNEELRARLGYSNDELTAAYSKVRDLESKVRNDSELVQKASSTKSNYDALMKKLRPRFAAGEDVFGLNPSGKYGFIREYDPKHYASLSQRIQHWNEEDQKVSKLHEHARKNLIPGIDGYIIDGPNYGQGYNRGFVKTERERFAHINSVLKQMEGMGIPRDEAFTLLNQYQMAQHPSLFQK